MSLNIRLLLHFDIGVYRWYIIVNVRLLLHILFIETIMITTAYWSETDQIKCKGCKEITNFQGGIFLVSFLMTQLWIYKSHNKIILDSMSWKYCYIYVVQQNPKVRHRTRNEPKRLHTMNGRMLYVVDTWAVQIVQCISSFIEHSLTPFSIWNISRNWIKKSIRALT